MKSIAHTILFAALLGLASSCALKEDFGEKIIEGIPTDVKLNYCVDHSEIITRAEQESRYEYRVDNIYILIFDSNGNRVTTDQSFFDTSNGMTVNNTDNSSTGHISFKTVSLANGKIIGVANLQTTVTSTAYNVTEENLDNIRTYSELEDYIIRMRENTIERGAMFLMTGIAVDNATNSTDITITGNETGTVTLGCTVILKRTDAKIRVHIKTTERPAAGLTDFSFKPTGWRILSVPSQTLLLDNNTAATDADDATCKYFDTPVRVFETLEYNPSNGLPTGGGFVFYMPENKKTYRQKINSSGDPAEDYKLREKWETEPVTGSEKPGHKENNIAFLNANANSTYMELRGTLSYVDEYNYHLAADVKYYIHLGSDVNNPNDYDTRRNTEYIYNITVAGVDDILVEVHDKLDPRPGQEGNVIYSNKTIMELDSHYDRILFTLNKTELGPDMYWGVNTPFSNGIHQINDTSIPEEMKDYRWIKFGINKLYGIDNIHYVKYPGDLNYDNPYISGDGLPSPFYSDYPDARLMDVHQLLRYLTDEANSGIYDDDETVTITAFVDENMYFVNPITDIADETRQLWKQSVDKEDRLLHIITKDALYSSDGNSSEVKSIYTFKQKAIRTVYDVTNPDVTTAWGIESISETGRLVTMMRDEYSLKYRLDDRNGRANTIGWLAGKKWNEVISTLERYRLHDSYNAATYACLLRNRDLNGDNIIDSDEIRWYLPAINQMVDIFIGEYALMADDRLYPTLESNRPGGNSVYWHYTSSSKQDNGIPYVLWAEEGASIGSYRGSSSGEINGKYYSYRCVRNLGILLSNPDEVPLDLVKYTYKSDGTYIIDLSRMNVKSKRTNLETVPLPLHNEKNANNRPYNMFEVLPGKYANNAQDWSYYQTTNVCPPGYRIPNQRELLIMATEIGGWEDTHYMSQTSFSMVGMSPYNNERKGFMYAAHNRNFMLRNNGGETGFVRCIKDINP